MPRTTLSQKVEAVFAALCDKGPLSISSLAEEVANLLKARTSTMRSAIVQILKDLEQLGLVKEVGTDKYGSKLIDITPLGFITLLGLLYVHGEQASELINLPMLVKALKRRSPEIAPYADAAQLILDTRKELSHIEDTEERGEFIDLLMDIYADITDFIKEKSIEWSDLKDAFLRSIAFMLSSDIYNISMEEFKKIVKNISSEEVKQALKDILVTLIEYNDEEIKYLIERKEKLNKLVSLIS